MKDVIMKRTCQSFKEIIASNSAIIDSVVDLLESDREMAMLLAAVYMDDRMAYDYFQAEMSLGHFEEFIEFFWGTGYLQKAIRESGLLERQIPEFVRYAYDGYDMWYHLMDGIVTILEDEQLAGMLAEKDRRINQKLFELWKDDALDEDNWDKWFRKLSDMYE